MSRQLICSSVITLDTDSPRLKSLKSSFHDNVKDGYIVGSLQGDGVLMSFTNVPLAYYDIPTLNRMVYSKALWESLFDSPSLKNAIQSNSFWMDSQHRDEDEVFLSNVAGRITAWDFGPNNTIVGNIDVLDTPNGRIIATLCRTGRVGTSTRGFGQLDTIGNGLTNVNLEAYMHVSSDFVATPAVPHSVIDTDITATYTNEYLDSFKQEMVSLLQEAMNKNPNTTVSDLYKMFSSQDLPKVDAVLNSVTGNRDAILRKYTIL